RRADPLSGDEPLLPARAAGWRELAGGRAGALVRAGRAVARRLLRAVRGAGLSPDRLALLRVVRRALPGRLAAALFRRIAGADRMGAALGAALAREWPGDGIPA